MAFFTTTNAPTVVENVKAKQRLPSAPKKLVPAIDCNVMSESALAEYRQVAEEVGVSAQDIAVEEFRLFLAKRDIPTFNLAEVIQYMDDVAAKDNPKGYGWHWCPVRAKDADASMTFGTPSVQDQRLWPGDTLVVSNSGRLLDGSSVVQATKASDFYESHRYRDLRRERYGVPTPSDLRVHRSPAYTRTIPLHALKKVAMIEREFGQGRAVFLVSDYTTAPHIVVNPDPFLMAVIPNSAVSHGKGRFVIDVWDEPGFGIEQMVK